MNKYKLSLMSSVGVGLIIVVTIAVFVPVSSGAATEKAAGFAGSARCGDCHETEANSWKHSLHSRFLRAISDAKKNEGFDLAALKPPFPVEDAAYVMGNMYKLVFLKGLKKSDAFVPHQYDIATGTWEPLRVELWDYGYGGKKAEGTNGVSWHERCAGCHVTGYNAAAGTFIETAIGCEDCHGPGLKHAESKKKDDIINPALLEGSKGNEVCARCHSHGRDSLGDTPYPSARTAEAILPASYKLSVAEPGKSNEVFLANGLPRKHHAQYNEFSSSKHFQSGIRCYDCHDVHRWRDVPPSRHTSLMAKTERFFLKSRARLVCLKCHADRERQEVKNEKGQWVDAHTRHPDWVSVVYRVDKEGKPITKRVQVQCKDCHMPSLGGEQDGYITSSHSFRTVMPLESQKVGVKDVCTSCHTEKDPAWAQKQIELWRTQK